MSAERPSRMPLVMIAFLAAVAVGGAGYSACDGTRSRGTAEANPDTARAPRFSPPRRIGIGPTVIQRRPALALSGSTVFVAAGLGSRLPARNPVSAAGDTASLMLAHLPGMPGVRPAGAFTFRFPRAVFDSRGVLHLVWGEAAETHVDSGAPARIVSLWHARFEQGHWTAPARIHEAQEIVWDPGASSLLVADSGSGLHVAAPAWTADGGWALAYLRNSGGRWTAADVHPPAPAAYADLAVGPSGQVAILYAAAHSTGSEPHTNALFSVVSLDGGTHWGNHASFGNVDHWPASGVRAAYGRDGTLHAVWMQRAAGAVDVRALWHAASADDGRTWGGFASAGMAGIYNTAQAVVSAAGEVHVVATWYHERRADLVYARFGGGRWTAPQPLFPARLGVEPNLRIDGRDRLHLLWIAQPDGVAVPLHPAAGDTIPWFELAYSIAESGR